MIRFDQTCDVGGQRYEVGTDADEATLPPDWVAGAIAAKFVHRLEAAATAKLPDPVRGQPAGKPLLPADVQTALDNATK